MRKPAAYAEAFRKLGIRSRSELTAEELWNSPGAPGPRWLP
ncbi:hypothetical protein [Fodinicola feengrottensis]